MQKTIKHKTIEEMSHKLILRRVGIFRVWTFLRESENLIQCTHTSLDLPFAAVYVLPYVITIIRVWCFSLWNLLFLYCIHDLSTRQISYS
jgi:hypothetical protein